MQTRHYKFGCENVEIPLNWTQLLGLLPLACRAESVLPAGESLVPPHTLLRAPLNLCPQRIIKPAQDKWKEHEGRPVFSLKKPKIPQTPWFKGLKYDHLATCTFINLELVDGLY